MKEAYIQRNLSGLTHYIVVLHELSLTKTLGYVA